MRHGSPDETGPRFQVVAGKRPAATCVAHRAAAEITVVRVVNRRGLLAIGSGSIILAPKFSPDYEGVPRRLRRLSVVNVCGHLADFLPLSHFKETRR